MHSNSRNRSKDQRDTTPIGSSARVRDALRLGLIGTALIAIPLAAASLLQAGVPGDGAKIPVPVPRPDVTITTGSVSGAATNAAREQQAFVATNPTQSAKPVAASGSLREGLDALYGRDVERARAIRLGMQPGTLDRKILAWAIALSGKRGVPSGEIAQIARALPDWPGQAVMRDNSELAIARENLAAQEIVAVFGDTQPTTLTGALLLVDALVATGDNAKAAKLISKLWRRKNLDQKLEARILRDFGGLLTQADHKYRMERLFYNERVSGALRVADKAGYTSLANAWAAVTRKNRNASVLLDKVPPKHRKEAGFIFARAKMLRLAKQYKQSAQVLLSVPRSRNLQVDGDEWWVQRRIVARELLDMGEAELAYQLASTHAAVSPAKRVEAEFHAGWFALSYLNNPQAALEHFSHIVKISQRPLSQSRGLYWMGRAAEQAGQRESATGYYQQAAQHPTTFYGQLAAAKLGVKQINVRKPEPTPNDRVRFASRDQVQAIKRLEEIGYGWRADVIYRSLGKQLDNPGELAILSAMAERKGNHTLGLQIGKTAHAEGHAVDTLAFPIGAIPASAQVHGAGLALAYSIARQESTFNAKAVSPAGARGLLQLLPGTAKQVARRKGLAYSRKRLTSDPAYNATLGAAYLEQQLARFDGSYILTFAGYNAGPSRAKQWIERYGDPRGKDVESIVDWIERIPFSETRNYVQRVMENMQVYKVRTGGTSDIVRDLQKGTPGG